jgi:hypothetical protein
VWGHCLRRMDLSAFHAELQTLARKRLTGLGFDSQFTEDQLYEIAYLLAHDALSAIDRGIDKYTDDEWRAANRIRK